VFVPIYKQLINASSDPTDRCEGRHNALISCLYFGFHDAYGIAFAEYSRGTAPDGSAPGRQLHLQMTATHRLSLQEFVRSLYWHFLVVDGLLELEATPRVRDIRILLNARRGLCNEPNYE
jgi:hypothetical protein